MDSALRFIVEQKIRRTCASLRQNNMNAIYAPTGDDALARIKGLIHAGDTVACGGSVTLSQIGAIDLLRQGRYNFIDRFKNGLTGEQLSSMLHSAFNADVLLSGTNAVTEEGELYNVDGNGNRVAAMIYGPKMVIIAAGSNKIVKDRASAIERVRSVAAPANAKRLSCRTPCTATGVCADCRSEDRICSSYVFLGRQRTAGRINVVLIGERLGY